MLVVGLQCGHDASVAVLMDGKVLIHLEKERATRVRHDSYMSASLIHEALDYCGLKAPDVDLFAVSTTQGSGYLSDDSGRLGFAYDWSVAERIGADRFKRSTFDLACRRSRKWSYAGRTGGEGVYNCESPEMPSAWTTGRGLAAIDDADGAMLEQIFSASGRASDQILPMTVTLDGRAYPAVAVMHQLSHAAAAFYQSGFETAAVLAHDNGSPVRRYGEYPGGMLFYGEGRHLMPIWTAPIAAGLIYSRSAEWIRLGGFAGAGKLMGLSAYGKPELFDGRFVGDVEALADRYVSYDRGERWAAILGWCRAVSRRAEQAGYIYEGAAFTAFGKDLAATAQATFEQLVLYTLDRLRMLLSKAGRDGPNLCLSGGCALNCPTNSRIVEETGFTSVFIPPSCDDGGLSIGAAFYVYHHVLGRERRDAPDPGRSIAALGRAGTAADVKRALDDASGEFEVDRGIDLAERVAEDLAANRVVALYQGRSESGPRALGHRSLLADPRQTENWSRVNGLKGRELWRPFAPACLAERLRDHFDGGPPHSPHMLFNYHVRSRTLGAVTHVDNTARVQTVAAGSGPFRDVLEAFERRTGTPVVLNTSLNGPGEPIVETPDHAVSFLRRTATDVLYLENNRVRRRAG